MNVRQKIALWVGLAALGLVCFFPPQIVVPPQPGLIATLQFQLGGPQARAGAELSGLPYTRYSFLFAPPPGSVGIDWQRFFLPLGFLLAATAGAVWTLQTKRLTPQARLLDE